jgi:hypothetical protein
MASDRGELERWRKQYRSARAAVDAAFAQELASMTDAEGLRRAQSLRLFAANELPSRDSSGLIEQQAIFRRLAGRR